ncbi:MAG: FAD:protein FMN transferase [Thermoanaerobaculia bacterium]
MGTICRITVPAGQEKSIEPAFDEIARIETFLSTWRDDSELSRINRAPLDAPVPVRSELLTLLRTAFHWTGETGGAFNPLVGPLVRLWKTREEGSFPGREAIRRALVRVDPTNVEIGWLEGTITRHRGAVIEEGGFGKGYAIGRALDVLRSRNVPHAVIDFGGQVALFGFHEPVEIAIADPEARQAPFAVVRMDHGSIATSSGSEQTFEVDGKRFTHIIDPRTGDALPPRGSVSVINDDPLLADILSTALYVMGPDDGVDWADRHGIAAVYILPSSRNHAIRATFAFRRQFDLEEIASQRK